MSANAPAVFNFQFFADAVGGVAMVAAGFKLHTYLNGTTTAHNTYTDLAGSVPNANPITLDDNGRCVAYLDPAVLYTFVLKDAADASTVETFNGVGPAALATDAVLSVNGLTGVVTLDASGIPYTTSSSASWLTADNVEAALDQIADQADSPDADAVSLQAISGLSSTNVQGAIAELAARASGSKLLRITPFTSTSTWTKGSDVSYILVKGVGGGGGGGLSGGSDAGGGGGGGGYAEKLITTPGATETVTIGAGGTSAATGGTTSFGSWCSASGGTGGGNRNGGSGGIGTGGDLNLRGGPGGTGTSNSEAAWGGEGGNSQLGGGAAASTSHGATGVSASANTGGGGAGGTSAGGVGGSGVVYVYEYGL